MLTLYLAFPAETALNLLQQFASGMNDVVLHQEVHPVANLELANPNRVGSCHKFKKNLSTREGSILP